MVRDYQVISVGTHVNPLPSMWAERIDPEYRDRAPRPVRRTRPRAWGSGDDLVRGGGAAFQPGLGRRGAALAGRGAAGADVLGRSTRGVGPGGAATRPGQGRRRRRRDLRRGHAALDARPRAEARDDPGVQRLARRLLRRRAGPAGGSRLSAGVGRRPRRRRSPAGAEAGAARRARSHDSGAGDAVRDAVGAPVQQPVLGAAVERAGGTGDAGAHPRRRRAAGEGVRRRHDRAHEREQDDDV